MICVIDIALPFGESVGPGAVFEVKPVGNGLGCDLHAAPVADDRSVESPFTLENVIEQILVVAAMLVLVQIVRTHYGPGTSFLYGSLEGRQVNLVQGPVIHVDIHGMAMRLLIVQGIMLHAGGNAVGLHSPDILSGHFPGEIRVLSHIFEIPSVERAPVDVHARSEKDILPAVFRLLTDADSVTLCK